MTGRSLSTLVCAVTPFAADGSLDKLGVEHLVERFGTAGVGTYIGGSSPGEGYSLSLAETEELFGLALGTMAGRQPVRAMGVEPHSAEDLLPVLRLAESVGLDGVQLYSLDCGHGNRPTAAEQERYFRTLLEAVELPAYISSHFAGGYLVPLDVLARLLDDYPHLSGFNVTTPDMGYLTRAVELADGRADVHVGGPLQALAAVAVGAQGFLSADGNLVPRLCASVIEALEAGDMVAAHTSYARLMKVFRINRWGGSMRWLKTAMRIWDLPGHHLRAPFLPLAEADEEVIRRELHALGIAETEGIVA